MLQIIGISKHYRTGELKQTALDKVSLNLRENEFVSILGPSGSGKTTLLNIIGGLDQYEGGDLIINGKSTKKYKNRDWDTYRNHTIGFVFQSYNLISHQSILSNVELALTIGGVSRAERKQRAKDALIKVGLDKQFHKRPNQLSGGQMQRVAIARALVNDPEILLADEPTGALDSETSIQVMELLKKVADDRLVVMVTHNSELAQRYSSRIVKLKDGQIIGDSNPYIIEAPRPKAEKESEQAKGSKKRAEDSKKKKSEAAEQEKPVKKAKMSFGTSLLLSFHNLGTKRGRTFLTSFAGSIGIIGIALILALSAGVNDYIARVQKESMASYPIKIQTSEFDLSDMIGGTDDDDGFVSEGKDDSVSTDKIYADNRILQRKQSMQDRFKENDLTAFKNYLDDPNSEINQYVGENGVIYSYDTKFEVFTSDKDGNIYSTDIEVDTVSEEPEGGEGEDGASGMNFDIGVMMGNNKETAINFSEMMAGKGDNVVSQVVMDSYDLVYGEWPKNYDEVVIILNQKNKIRTEKLFQLGLISAEQYKEVREQISDKEEPKEISVDYKEACEKTMYLLAACDRYQKNEYGFYRNVSDEELSKKYIEEHSIPLKITGVIRPTEDAANADISTVVGYTSELTEFVIRHTDESSVVKAQEADETVNVLTGEKFEKDKDAEEGAGDSPLSFLNPMQMFNPTSMFRKSSFDDNMNSFGKIYYDAPKSISIYTDSFEDKDNISACINRYNESVEEEQKITYTDYMALLTSSITSIVNAITFVLIAFVGVSLIVSSIMIGIITHISVLERTKEIGILRALGASKRNVSQVFNAETVIIGFCSGALGVLISWLLTFPINMVIEAVVKGSDVSAKLPTGAALLLIVISVVITVIGGLIPAKKAAMKDPVIALRTE